MIPRNLHLPNTYYETFRVKVSNVLSFFLNRHIGGKEGKKERKQRKDGRKVNERKKRKKKFKSKRPSTYYISFIQTLTEFPRQARHHIGNCDKLHLFRMKFCIIQLLSLLHIIRPNTFLKKFLTPSEVYIFPNKLTGHCFTQVTGVSHICD